MAAQCALGPFIAGVALLFAAFGGSLTKLAPPQQVGGGNSVGLLSFVVLIVLLIVAVMGRSAVKTSARKGWIVAGIAASLVALPAVILYPRELADHTFRYPVINLTITYVNGSDKDLKPQARDYKRSHPDSSPADLEQNFDYDQLWTSESIRYYEMVLLVMYGWLVLSIATAVFCLLQRRPVN
ncbi:MAG: hypothetical protein ACLPYS_04790 [Vulcanimicrobiaceae bacterium]